ncbi:MAG: hypothetical protein WB562_07560, partial [Candidatus Sulfotelmatobacter sp.]
GSSHEPWSCSSHTNLLAAMSQRRYAITRSGCFALREAAAQSKDPYSLQYSQPLMGFRPHSLGIGRIP